MTAPSKGIGSGVVVRYRLDATPQAGQPATVAFSFDGISSPLGASVRFSTDGGVRIISPTGSTSLPSGQVTSFDASLVAGEGIGYLHVFTSQNGIESVTSVAIAPARSASSLPDRSELKQLPDGEKILSIPVK